jgi:hypothetical protein
MYREVTTMVEQSPLGTATEGGPLSSKMTAAAVGASASALFWAIAGMTFAKSWGSAELATITTLTTAFVGTLVGFYTQERPRYTEYNRQWQAAKRVRKSAHAQADATARKVQDLDQAFAAMQASVDQLDRRVKDISGTPPFH